MNIRTAYGVSLSVLVAFCWLMVMWLAQPLWPTVAVHHPAVIIQISTSTDHVLSDMKPILSRDKHRFIDRDYLTDENVVALPESDKEMLWAKGKELWCSAFPNPYGRLNPPQFVASSSFPIKSVALSSDGKYAAYVVRRLPVPTLPDYVSDGCVEKLGDTVVLHNMETGVERIVYKADQATPGIGDLNFLPERDDLIFNDGKVYSFNPQKAILIELTGFSNDKDDPDRFRGECGSLSFFALSPHGRYGIVHYFDEIPPALDYVYDFQKDQLLGGFVYPDDFGGESVLGFVAEDQLLVFDDSYVNFQQNHFPRLAIFNLQGNQLLTVATTSRGTWGIWSMPEIFVTSSLGWHIGDPYQETGAVTMIFDPFTFKVSTSTLNTPPLWEKITWSRPRDGTSTYLSQSYDDINFDPQIIDAGDITDVAAR